MKATYLTAVIVGMITLATGFFSTPIIGALTPFFAPLLFLAVFVTAAVAAIILCVIAVRGGFQRSWQASGPAALLLGCLAFGHFAPLNHWWHTYYFHVYRGTRETVVERLLPVPADQKGSTGIVRLDFPASMSSIGGEVHVVRNDEESAVLFFTFRGILDPFSGFIYTRSGREPNLQWFMARRILTMRRIDDHWFYVACGG